MSAWNSESDAEAADEAAKQWVSENMGAKVVYNLWEAPDNVSMAAVAMAISGGGALSKYETTVLLTVEETMDAMQRARDIRYRPPGT
jgi:hypothetical protein